MPGARRCGWACRRGSSLLRRGPRGWRDHWCWAPLASLGRAAWRPRPPPCSRCRAQALNFVCHVVYLGNYGRGSVEAKAAAIPMDRISQTFSGYLPTAGEHGQGSVQAEAIALPQVLLVCPPRVGWGSSLHTPASCLPGVQALLEGSRACTHLGTGLHGSKVAQSHDLRAQGWGKRCAT